MATNNISASFVKTLSPENPVPESIIKQILKDARESESIEIVEILLSKNLLSATMINETILNYFTDTLNFPDPIKRPGSIKIMELLLFNDKADPNYNNGIFLKIAICHKKISLMKTLMRHPKINLCPKNVENYPIWCALTNKNTEVIKIIQDDPRFCITLNNIGNEQSHANLLDFSIMNEFTFLMEPFFDGAIKKRYLKTIERMIIEKLISSEYLNKIMIDVCFNEDIDIIKLLLTRPEIVTTFTDVTNSNAIEIAYNKNRLDIVKLLMPKADISKIMKTNNPDLIGIAKELGLLKDDKTKSVHDALETLMKDYNLKSIYIENGKEYRIIFNS